MNINDYIGKRGENLFRVIITEFCEGKPLFDETFLGEKHPTTDFLVELVGRAAAPAAFFVQVKSTRSNYRGQGDNRKLVVKVSKAEVETLARLPLPSYIVGVDIDLGRGYIINAKTLPPRGLHGIPIKNLLGCESLKRLWQQVDEDLT